MLLLAPQLVSGTVLQLSRRGAETPDNVALREIRPDGVILEFQGQRFFFPRDGH